MKKNLWIIEDNRYYSSVLKRLINESPDYSCENVFRSCEAALKIINDNALPDIILMDIRLEGKSGIEGTLEIKTRYPEIEIIMLTVEDNDNSIFEALSNGASGYLLKNTEPEKIIERINDIFQNGSPISPYIAKRIINKLTQYDSQSKTYQLSNREKEILKEIVDGQKIEYIADLLHISPLTIRTHIKKIYQKLQVHSRSSLVSKILRERLL